MQLLIVHIRSKSNRNQIYNSKNGVYMLVRHMNWFKIFFFLISSSFFFLSLSITSLHIRTKHNVCHFVIANVSFRIIYKHDQHHHANRAQCFLFHIMITCIDVELTSNVNNEETRNEETKRNEMKWKGWQTKTTHTQIIQKIEQNIRVKKWISIMHKRNTELIENQNRRKPYKKKIYYKYQ